MADIDKALPNDKRPEEVAEEVDVTEIEELKGPVEITEDEEGATIDFDPRNAYATRRRSLCKPKRITSRRRHR